MSIGNFLRIGIGIDIFLSIGIGKKIGISTSLICTFFIFLILRKECLPSECYPLDSKLEVFVPLGKTLYVISRL